jgi:hypothetical protein
VIRPLLVAALVGMPTLAFAQTTTPTPTSSPSPAPSVASNTPTDICSSGLSAIVSRPTQTTAACVVKSNHVLIESGYQSQTVKVSGPGSFTFQTVPNATIRVGTALKNVEFDLIPPTSIRSSGVSATSDIGAGVRWQIYSTPTVAYSVNAIATANTGSNPLNNPNGLGSTNTGTYIANANIQGAFGKVFGYGATFSYQDLATAGIAGSTRFISLVPSVELTYSMPAAWTLALEAFRQTNGEGPQTQGHTWYDAALMKDIGSKAQFDINYGVSNGIVPAPGVAIVQRHYVGAGVSYYF